MYLASDVLEQKGNMVFIENYWLTENSLISYPRLEHLHLEGTIPIGVLLESCGQSGELLCRSLLEDVHEVYLVKIENFVYKAIAIRRYHDIRYETKLLNRVNNYFQTSITIYIKEDELLKFMCTHYLK